MSAGRARCPVSPACRSRARVFAGPPPASGRSRVTRGEHDRVRRLALLAYVVVGVIVASGHDYYTNLAFVSRVVSAVVATALWPLILLGASLHLNFGAL
jgi:hypothetical protein